MFTKFIIALCFFTVFVSACADSVHTAPALTFHRLCGDWCCVYFRVAEHNSKSEAAGVAACREYYFLKEDGLSFKLNPDSTCRFTMAFCPDSFALGKVLDFDTHRKEMRVVNIYHRQSDLDSSDCFQESFHWSQGVDDTLLLSLVHHSADKESHFTYKLLRR